MRHSVSCAAFGLSTKGYFRKRKYPFMIISSFSSRQRSPFLSFQVANFFIAVFKIKEYPQERNQRYRQVLCANSFTSLAEHSLHRAEKLSLNHLVAEDRERSRAAKPLSDRSWNELECRYCVFQRSYTFPFPARSLTSMPINNLICFHVYLVLERLEMRTRQPESDASSVASVYFGPNASI